MVCFASALGGEIAELLGDLVHHLLLGEPEVETMTLRQRHEEAAELPGRGLQRSELTDVVDRFDGGRRIVGALSDAARDVPVRNREGDDVGVRTRNRRGLHRSTVRVDDLTGAVLEDVSYEGFGFHGRDTTLVLV